MDCYEIKKIICLYVDNQLAKKKKQKFEKHISGCENCRYELETSIRIFKEYVELSDVRVSEDVKDKIFENIISLPIKPTSSFKNRLALLIGENRARLDLNPNFKPSVKFGFAIVLILGFVLIGINHFQKNIQQNQDDLLEIFERTPFLERTYNLSFDAHSVKLDHKMNNSVDGIHKKIDNLKTKHEKFLSFSAYDVEINKLKNRINQMKNENFLWRNSS